MTQSRHKIDCEPGNCVASSSPRHLVMSTPRRKLWLWDIEPTEFHDLPWSPSVRPQKLPSRQHKRTGPGIPKNKNPAEWGVHAARQSITASISSLPLSNQVTQWLSCFIPFASEKLFTVPAHRCVCSHWLCKSEAACDGWVLLSFTTTLTPNLRLLWSLLLVVSFGLGDSKNDSQTFGCRPNSDSAKTIVPHNTWCNMHTQLGSGTRNQGWSGWGACHAPKRQQDKKYPRFAGRMNWGGSTWSYRCRDRKKGSFGKGAVQKCPSSRDSKAFQDSKDSWEPQSVGNKGESDHFLEILEHLESLDILEIHPAKTPFRNGAFFRSGRWQEFSLWFEPLAFVSSHISGLHKQLPLLKHNLPFFS